MLSNLITFTTILAVTSALPAGSEVSHSPFETQHQIANFDNDAGLPALAVAPIGTANLILFNGMALVQTQSTAEGVPYVDAHSAPNYAAYSKFAVPTLLQGQPAMSVDYPSSIVDHFDLGGFWYGCAAGSEESVIGVPLPCTIEIKGYKDSEGKELVATQEFDYNIELGDLNTQMIQAKVDKKFKGLKKVEFFVSDDTYTAALIDDVAYTVYVKKQGTHP